MAQRMHYGSISAGALTEPPATPRAATSEPLLDRGQHLGDQEVLPRTRCCRIDILVAANPGEEIGKRDHDWRHTFLPNEAIEAFRHVLCETRPVGIRQATTRNADQVNEQGQPVTVLAGMKLLIAGTCRRIAKDICLEDLAFQD